MPVLTLVVRNGAISLKKSRAVSKAVKLHLQWDLASQCFGVYPRQIRANSSNMLAQENLPEHYSQQQKLLELSPVSIHRRKNVLPVPSSHSGMSPSNKKERRLNRNDVGKFKHIMSRKRSQTLRSPASQSILCETLEQQG